MLDMSGYRTFYFSSPVGAFLRSLEAVRHAQQLPRLWKLKCSVAWSGYESKHFLI
jgi:hypothetical protein